MKAFLFLFSSVSILGAQGVEELIAEGDALDRKNRNFEAVAFYLKADSQKPEEAKILWRISKQYAQLMMDAKSASERKRLGQKALDAAQGAVSADPKDSQAHLSLAIAYFAKAIALQPQRVIHRVELGRAYLAIGKREKARDAFNKGIPCHPPKTMMITIRRELAKCSNNYRERLFTCTPLSDARNSRRTFPPESDKFPGDAAHSHSHCQHG